LTIKTINPSTEEVIQEYENITKEELVDKTRKSKEAFEEWKKDPHKRADYIYAFASELRKNKDTKHTHRVPLLALVTQTMLWEKVPGHPPSKGVGIYRNRTAITAHAALAPKSLTSPRSATTLD
jgi:hypothetical protein